MFDNKETNIKYNYILIKVIYINFFKNLENFPKCSQIYFLGETPPHKTQLLNNSA